MRKFMFRITIAITFIGAFLCLSGQLYAEEYQAEYATLTGTCWTVDVWNIPMTGNQDNKPDYSGNMKFFDCGDTIAPLYKGAFVIGWKDGADKIVYSNALAADSTQYHLLARGPIQVDSVGQPSAGDGYMYATGSWCTPDSAVFGTVQYIVPAYLDTAVLIEKVVLWNEAGVPLNDLIVGEDVDWNVERVSGFDKSGVYFEPIMVYQYGSTTLDVSIAAAMASYGGHDNGLGISSINSYDFTSAYNGYLTEDLYDLISNMDGSFNLFSDSANGTDLRTLHRFKEGTLEINDTIQICRVMAVNINGYHSLGRLLTRGLVYITRHDLCEQTIPVCQGICGDANQDSKVGLSDAVFIINYIFSGGSAPKPVLACGDYNADGKINVSDAVRNINYVFSGGNPPGDCAPGSPNWDGQDCCPFAP